MHPYRGAVRLMALAALLVVALPAAAQTGQTTVTVIHAVPAENGFPADVYLDGELLIDGFVFEAVSDTLTLEAGREVELAIFPDGADPATDSPALSQTVTLEEGDFTIVAHLVEGAPVLSIFENDVSTLEAGQARLTVRQTSGVPTIDVLADGETLFDGLTVPDDATSVLDTGAHDVAFLAPDGGEPLIEQTVEFPEGVLTVIYAVGSPDDGTFNLLVQNVAAAQTVPSGVPTGTGGLKDPGLDRWLAALGLTAVAALAVRRVLVAGRR